MQLSQNLVLPKPRHAPLVGIARPGIDEHINSNPKRLKVLVVDDERDLADLTGELLRMHGVEVLLAYSGADALRILHDDGEVTSVFSDVMMPEMTGFDLAKTISDRYPGIHVVLTSAYAFPEIVVRDNLVWPFLAKPYRIASVLALLRADRTSC
jgi:CheY-like chemotaxis protein